MKTLEASKNDIPVQNDSAALLEAARIACQRIAPLWPLKDFVAVNPFLGLAHKPFIEACTLLRKMIPGGMQMPAGYYREKYLSGEITIEDLGSALEKAKRQLPCGSMLEGLDLASLKQFLTESPEWSDGTEILTVLEAVDRTDGTNWQDAISQSIGQFCAAYYDAGQSAWQLPWRKLPLFQAWREFASSDASLEVLGLEGFRAFVKSLPASAEDALVTLLQLLGVRDACACDFLHKALLTVLGWAGYVQYLVRENGMRQKLDDSLFQFLAIRLSYEAALLKKYDSPAIREFWLLSENSATPAEVIHGFICQIAQELAWQRQLLGKLQTVRSAAATWPMERPAVQAVFCIDVRSEVFRRALEDASSTVQTLGFAGFFGMPIEYVPFGQSQGTSQCPVLLTPAYKIEEKLLHATAEAAHSTRMKYRLGKRLTYSWNSFKTSAVSCFSFIETAGIAFGAKLFQDAFTPASTKEHREQSFGPNVSESLTLDARVQLAAGALKNMGLTKNFARLVLVCGHGSETANNPYGCALDCGACGGHAGDANARVAAAIFNDPAVREALAAQGIVIPADTWFLAGLHNTTTDAVELFDLAVLPTTHTADLSQLQGWLTTAGRAARRERADSLGLDASSDDLEDEVLSRSRDWAQVRPEWGLAGNAAFIAAPRARTKGANLGGRVFLHDYNHNEDPGDGILELIMVAPMVVANWINLQYYGSTVNNAVFGSGTKVTHNVVGTLGICQGNGGDLQTGLPLQSVHDGTKWMHAPLRLHVMIEAPRERIAAVLEKHANVRQLVENGWLLLFAIEAEGECVVKRLPGGVWEEVPAESPALAA